MVTITAYQQARIDAGTAAAYELCMINDQATNEEIARVVLAAADAVPKLRDLIEKQFKEEKK